MTTASEAVGPAATPPSCWCCGRTFSESELVRLGAHPEVAVCAGCAHFLHRRARRQEREHSATVGSRMRGAVDVVRDRVVSQGWHEKPVIGRLLRRLDRLLP